MRMDVDGRRKGRLKLTWIGSVNVDLREKRLSGEETQNMDRQCRCGLEGEETVGRGDAVWR